jgi:hypothetical protein
MAFLTRTQLKALWVQLFQPQETNYDDVWDSHEKAPRTATITAGAETSMEVRYNGDAAPTLTKEANGEYRLDLATTTGRVSFVWRESGGTLTTANSIKLKVRDADGSYRHTLATVFSSTSGDEFGPSASVTRKYTEPVAGDTVIEFANMSNVPGDWRIIGIIS